jgi:hypothetical protein
MKLRSTTLPAALFWALSGLALPGAAQTGLAAPAPAPTAGQATEFISVRLNGEPVNVRVRGIGTDAFEMDASLLFDRLQSRFETQGSILGYWRFQDGAVMGLDFADGKVRANGAVLGKIPEFPVREAADTWLSPNAIAVLTGTKVTFNAASGWQFDLDDRLKPKFDLDLWINGAPATVATGTEPRTVGPVLLVPLRAVAAALGHTLTEDLAAGTVEVTRVHDSAVIKLELATGLVSINGIASGVTPSIAFADRAGLILPFSAVETLTGSHIVLTPGSRRVEVTLDDRLSSLALPGERVVDAAGKTPFTAERLDYQLSDRGPIKLDFHARFQGYNTVTTVETAGGIGAATGLTPRWVSVDIAALSGWRGSLGDYAGQLREFSGTETSRIRGVSYRTRQASGAIVAIAAGVPLTGAVATEGGGSTPQFGGLAAGIRQFAADGRSDRGAAVHVSADGTAKRVVIGGQKDLIAPAEASKRVESAFVSADIGVFSDAAATTVDVRARGEARYRLSPQASASAALSYDGARFQAGAATGAAPAGARAAGTLALDWHAAKPIGALRNVAGGVRGALTHSGGAAPATTMSTNAAVSARLGAHGPDLSLDAGLTRFDGAAGAEHSSSFAARAWQTFDWGSATAGYTRTQSAAAAVDQRFTASAAFATWRRALPKGASVSVAPSASFVWTPAATEARLGATASADSGQAFGERFKLNGQFVALTTADTQGDAANVFGNLGASWRLGRAVQLQAGYNTDFSARHDFTVGLRGSLTFAEARRHTAPKAGTGVLKGRVFFDKNRDGLRQENEPGIPGVRLSVMGTRLGLNVDAVGSYTIQNIKTGLYTLSLDRSSLPLGLLIAEDAIPRATIGDGRVTSLDIPVIASGQVRGAVFRDANGNGTLDKGETRLEGEWIALVRATTPDGEPETKPGVEPGGERKSIQSAAFGQYGFENLGPGQYRLEVRAGAAMISVPVELDEKNLFAEVNIPLPPGADVPVITGEADLMVAP